MDSDNFLLLLVTERLTLMPTVETSFSREKKKKKGCGGHR